MFHEYAVEPQAIGTSWQTFRYIIEKFGFDKGRLISQYPKGWFREVYDAGAGLPPMQKKRIGETLNLAKRNKIVRLARPYDPNLGDWLDNATLQQATTPFHAIIARENTAASASILIAAELDELDPLMAVAHDRAIARDAVSLAMAMGLLLRASSHVLIVDPYYDPFDARYQNTLRECLRIVHEANLTTACEVHHIEHNKCASPEAIGKAASLKFRGVIPDAMSVVLYRWREKDGGEDFHARYLLTERGGIRLWNPCFRLVRREL